MLKALEDLPALFLEGIVTAINGLFAAMAALLNEVIAGMLALGLGMPTIPSIPQGPYLGWMNWLYPVGQAVAILTAAVTMYLVWFGIRYLFKLLHFWD